MNHQIMLWRAGRLIQAFTPYCEKIAPAGSLRRGKPEVKDVELMVIPKGGRTIAGAEIYVFLDDLLERGWIEQSRKSNGHLKAWGYRWRAFQAYDQFLDNWYSVDMFLCEQWDWGYHYLIRTGSADFSRTFMTHSSKRGALPEHLIAKNSLWNPNSRKPHIPYYLPTEVHTFMAIGVPYIPPYQRHDEKLLLQFARERDKQPDKNSLQIWSNLPCARRYDARLPQHPVLGIPNECAYLPDKNNPTPYTHTTLMRFVERMNTEHEQVLSPSD